LFIEQEQQRIGYFGFFECINDFKVAKTLFDSSEKWLKENNIEIMRGPVDGRIDNRCGFLLNGFDKTPFIFSSYNPKYYNDLVKKYDMKKSRDLLLYWLDLHKPIPDYLKQAADRIKEKGYKIRGFNRLRARNEMDWFTKSMMKTFSSHWGYINAPEGEVRNRFGLKHARWLADSGLFLIAESKNGKRIAFKWSTPDYNQIIKRLNGKIGILGVIKFFTLQSEITQGRFNFVGIDKEHRGQGLGSAMNYWTMLEMKKRRYTGAECGWIDEKNIASQRTIEKTGAKLYKKVRVYEKKI
jgi:predicted GNAT family acetyltransferase